MMSRFNGQDLFGSGGHEFEVGGLSLRHVLQESPGGLGVRVVGQGRGGREIRQSGELRADTPAKLEALMGAIEEQLDGLAHELSDGQGQVWAQTVMMSVERGTTERLGPRWKMEYRITYLQVRP
ncbi:MAG: hypothetical protein IT443_01790 [Phycisphaeraceae bacterium]|nr:hypothetical protein [Phycisphaeraceae bacterium]